MAPTQCAEEEGRPYKEYAYSPVPVSCGSALNESTNIPSNKNNCSTETNVGLRECCRPSDSQGEKALVNNDKSRQRGDADMSEKGSQFLQYVAAAAGNLCVFATGVMLGWTSPILSRLQQKNPISEDNPLGEPLTEDQSSWIGSLVAIGAIHGSFAAGYLAERWGRKNSLLLSVVPFTIGWILIATATHFAQLCVARLVFGFALAFPFTIIPMYVGEIAETSVRGTLGSFLQLFISGGLLFSYAIGPYVSYTAFWIICGCIPIIFFMCFIPMPESPYYLLIKGRKDEAIASLAKLRGKTAVSVQKEADEMQAAVEEAFRQQATLTDLFKVKSNFKALVYTCALVSFQQFTGINFVLFYMEKIFQDAGTGMEPSQSTIIVGVVLLLASGVTPLIVDRLGRRILLVLSGVGATLTLGALGIYFYLQTNQDVSSIGWLPVVALVIYICLYSIGWGPLPWAVMGEMFAPNVKSKASGITVSVCWLLAFFITKFPTDIEKAFGRHTTFWAFGVFCILSVCFTVFILPETKGKSLQQIQDELEGIKSSPSLHLGSSGSAAKT